MGATVFFPFRQSPRPFRAPRCSHWQPTTGHWQLGLATRCPKMSENVRFIRVHPRLSAVPTNHSSFPTPNARNCTKNARKGHEKDAVWTRFLRPRNSQLTPPPTLAPPRKNSFHPCSFLPHPWPYLSRSGTASPIARPPLVAPLGGIDPMLQMLHNVNPVRPSACTRPLGSWG
jgi:hypothetical protein